MCKVIERKGVTISKELEKGLSKADILIKLHELINLTDRAVLKEVSNRLENKLDYLRKSYEDGLNEKDVEVVVSVFDKAKKYFANRELLYVNQLKDSFLRIARIEADIDVSPYLTSKDSK